jgi:hypothetical protein
VQLLTTVADWLNLTFVFVTNLARIKNYSKNSLLHASGVLHYLTWSWYIHVALAAPVLPSRLYIIYIQLRMQQQQQSTIAGIVYLKRQKHHQQRKRQQFRVHIYSSRATFQLMFTHDCVSIEKLLWPVVWAVVARYDWLHDRSLIATTCSTIINRTIDLFTFYLIARLMKRQLYDHLQPIAGQ